MAEKLYKCHCRVSGHGILCQVAHDKKKSKKELNKLRRRIGKKDYKVITGRQFNPYDLNEIADWMEGRK